MIISRTPLRISFVGGGSDLPGFADQHGGAVVSTTIDKYVHVIVAPRFEGDVRVSYSRTETVPSAREVEHELVREGLKVCGLPRGLEVLTLSDVPSGGTGLGSSSTVMVGLLNALYAYQGVYRSDSQLAAEAAQIEIDVLGKPIGRQDQYAAAFGGLQLIEFSAGGGVRVEPIVCSREAVVHLHRSLLLFYTGRQRSADDVLARQREAIDEGSSLDTLKAMRDLAYEFRDKLAASDIDALGPLLHRNWELKRSLAGGVSDEIVDRWFEAAIGAGATGGKLLGAGAGGFLLFFAAPERQASVRTALDGLREVPFHFASRGTQILLFDGGHV